MANFIAQIQAPLINFPAFSVGDFSPAFTWQEHTRPALQTGGGASVVGWASASGTAGGTTEVFTIQTSHNGLQWFSFAILAAISGDQVVSLNANGAGVGAIKKPMKYLRLGYTSGSGSGYSSGTLNWGIL
jgi:hypothetical protein